MSTLLTSYRQYLKNIGYKEASQKQLYRCVEVFAAHIQKDITVIDSADIQQYYDYLNTRPLQRGLGTASQAWIKTQFQAIRNFFHWLEKNEIITHNPTTLIEEKRFHYVSRQPLDTEQIQALFASSQTLQEKVLLHLFYSCGLRLSEAVKLKIQDVHFASSMLYVTRDKNGKRRAVPLTAAAQSVLHQYCRKRLPVPDPHLLLNDKGKALPVYSYHKILQKLKKSAGIEVPLSPHVLRHSIATHLLKNGLNIQLIKEFLGHSHVDTTQLYTKVSSNTLNQKIQHHASIRIFTSEAQ